MSSQEHSPALAEAEDIISFARALTHLAEKLHASLRRLTAGGQCDTTVSFALLTEEYALRARASILHNSASRHSLLGIDFGQEELMNNLRLIENTISDASSLSVLQSVVSDLMTFSVSIYPGKAKVVNYLAREFGFCN